MLAVDAGGGEISYSGKGPTVLAVDAGGGYLSLVYLSLEDGLMTSKQNHQPTTSKRKTHRKLR